MSSFRRLFIAVLTAVLLVAGAAAAAGAPGTMRVLQVSPALGQKVTITGPAGDRYYVEPGRALVRVTPSNARGTVEALPPSLRSA